MRGEPRNFVARARARVHGPSGGRKTAETTYRPFVAAAAVRGNETRTIIITSRECCCAAASFLSTRKSQMARHCPAPFTYPPEAIAGHISRAEIIAFRVGELRSPE